VCVKADVAADDKVEERDFLREMHKGMRFSVNEGNKWRF
jgi:hypothetical protein